MEGLKGDSGQPGIHLFQYITKQFIELEIQDYPECLEFEEIEATRETEGRPVRLSTSRVKRVSLEEPVLLD